MPPWFSLPERITVLSLGGIPYPELRLIVHPTVSANVGEDIKGPLGTDVNSYKFGEDMLTATEEGKWVGYVYLNPTTEKEE